MTWREVPQLRPVCGRTSKQGEGNGGDVQRRVLLREVQGEARGLGRSARQRQRHPDGEGQVPRLRHQPEPHPRQGLAPHRASHQGRSYAGRP